MPRSTPPIRRTAIALASIGLVLASCASADPDALDETDPAETSVTVADPTSTSTTASDTAAERGDDSESDTDLDAEPRFELVGELVLGTAEVNELIAFVEDQTGRPFLRPPVIVAQTPDEFVTGLLAMTSEEEADARAQAEVLARTYQVLGLSDQTPSVLFENIQTFAGSPLGIGGYYDPDADELYVPNLVDPDADIDEFRGLLVHELTHALDGQHVDLAGLVDDVEADADAFLDAVFADRALVEGRATAVQQLFLEEEGVQPAVPVAPDFDVPLAYVSSLVLPYQVGGGWVMGNGGPAGSWELYDSELPPSEAMIFGPTAGDETEVDAPGAPTNAADLPVVADGTVGATGMFMWLAGDEAGATPAVNAALDAAMGWAGDTYVLVGDASTTCIAATFVADTPGDLIEIEAAFTTWADEAPAEATRSIVSTDEAVTVEGCAPFLG